jgi:hypothetical protein
MYESQKRWRKEHLAQDNAYRTKWAQEDRKKYPEFYRAREFAREMREYGATIEWYRDKLIEQRGVCALCGHLNYFRGKLQRLQVDHDHACCNKNAKSCGKCLRGLLCNECNMTLSYIEKWIGEKMNSASTYLKKYQ